MENPEQTREELKAVVAQYMEGVKTEAGKLWKDVLLEANIDFDTLPDAIKNEFYDYYKTMQLMFKIVPYATNGKLSAGRLYYPEVIIAAIDDAVSDTVDDSEDEQLEELLESVIPQEVLTEMSYGQKFERVKDLIEKGSQYEGLED